jgi:hypothetical protein
MKNTFGYKYKDSYIKNSFILLLLIIEIYYLIIEISLKVKIRMFQL